MIKTIISTLLSCVICISMACYAHDEGVFLGTLGNKSILLCIEGETINYRYQGHADGLTLKYTDINTWEESAGGKITGRWVQTPQWYSSVQAQWQSMDGKKKFPIELTNYYKGPNACHRREYLEDVLLPLANTTTLPLSSIKVAYPANSSIALGGSYSAAVIRPDGSLWAWGKNTLGLSRKGEIMKGAPLLLPYTLAQIHTGTCEMGIKEDGTLWQLGTLQAIPSDDLLEKSKKATVSQTNTFIKIKSWGNHCAGLKTDGTLWGMEEIETPETENPEGDERRAPPNTRPVLLATSVIDFDAAISYNNEDMALIRTDGSLWVKSSNDKGQKSLPPYSFAETIFTLVGAEFSRVALNANTTAGIKTDHSLWMWGAGQPGLINGQPGPYKAFPPTKIGDDFTRIELSSNLAVALKKDNSLWAWGTGKVFDSCLYKTVSTPQKLGDGFIDYSVNQWEPYYIAANKSDGTTWTWGYDWDDIKTQDQNTQKPICVNPTQVIFNTIKNRWSDAVAPEQQNIPLFPPSNSLGTIKAGRTHSALLKPDGTLWAWGGNEFEQLGDNSQQKQLTPHKIAADIKEINIKGNSTFWRDALGKLTIKGKDPKDYYFFILNSSPPASTNDNLLADREVLQPHFSAQIHARSGATAYTLKADGSLWRLGINTDGQAINPVNSGTQIRALSGSLALRTDGSLWNYTSNPAELIALDFAQIAPSQGYTYGIKLDGKLLAWGTSQFNELAEGKTEHAGPSNAVVLGEGFVSIAAGVMHGLGLKADGTLWAWGNNNTGALGDGTRTNQPKPVQIGAGYSQIAAGDYHSLGIKTDGTVWAWGSNIYGQLGDGTEITRLRPVQIIPLQSPLNETPQGNNQATAPMNPADEIKKIDVGYSIMCALFKNGTVKCRDLGWPDYWALDTRGLQPISLWFENTKNAVDLMVFEKMACATLSDGAQQCFGKEQPRNIENPTHADNSDQFPKPNPLCPDTTKPHCSVDCRTPTIKAQNPAEEGILSADLTTCQTLLQTRPLLKEASHIFITDRQGVCGLIANKIFRCDDSVEQYNNIQIDNLSSIKSIYRDNYAICVLLETGKINCLKQLFPNSGQQFLYTASEVTFGTR